tara:strand:+ start:132 stop:2369 length:2238 start_codon:yes stop_codon:yes gene_type:complete
MFVKIAFPISSFQLFTYSIPENLSNDILIGIRVEAILNGRKSQGIIVEILDKPEFKGIVKPINNILDSNPLLTEKLWKVLKWISQYYLTPIGQVFKAAIPTKFSLDYNPPQSWSIKISKKYDFKDILYLKKKAPVQYLLLNELLNQHGFLSREHLTLFAKNPLNICKELEKKKYIKIVKHDLKNNLTNLVFEPIKRNIVFNDEQKIAIKKIISSIKIEKFKTFLLHGVTGSGKTEIYIESIKQVLNQDKNAIILLPEISLTPQIAGRFQSVFGDSVALWHSKLSKQQRAWTWKQIYLNKYKVVIGARSAIFTPLKNIGLIVVDEEQESTYRQESPSPRYHARDVAIIRAKIEGSSIILSSATPSLETYHNALNKKFEYLSLTKRYGKAKYPVVSIVNIAKEENGNFTPNLLISNFLINKIKDKLLKKEQVLILQNRRGFSPTIKCLDCGEVSMCPFCKVSLTFHSYEKKMLCHQCNHSEKINYDNCSSCKSKRLLHIGAGTQRVESILNDEFPNTIIKRLDHDIVNKGSEITAILQDFLKNKIQILIGTQMIAKGLDFPNVTLVGIINADLGMSIPDFRAGEKVFQLLYQASGRAGRGKKPGEVVIQTYDEKNEVIQFAAKFKLKEYYNYCLKEREELNYPPFSWLVKIEFMGPSIDSLMAFAQQARKKISPAFEGLEILGPAPCFLEKIRNNYRVQIIFKSIKLKDPNGKKIHQYINENFYNISSNHNNKSSKVIIHFDPISMI